MFEAFILLALLGIILLYIVTGERSHSRHSKTFIDLSAELKPSTGKIPRVARSKER